MLKKDFIELKEFPKYPVKEMKRRSEEFFNLLKKRRTIREFSIDDIPVEVIKNCIAAAASAPSGANKQPWHFVIVRSPAIKREIRINAEKEEHEFYENRASEEWLEALKPLGTNQDKPFLELAPYLIVVFEKKYGIDELGNKVKYYYTKESVGIACGMLITALHHCGLATLTHTPSPMNFLNKILNRPKNEKPYLILVTGYPAEKIIVPAIEKKKPEEVITLL